MSKPMIKATYTLDANTIRKLENLARRHGVTVSQALKEAVTLAAVNGANSPSRALKALDRLQDSLKLTTIKARSWIRQVRAERRRSSSRHAARVR